MKLVRLRHYTSIECQKVQNQSMRLRRAFSSLSMTLISLYVRTKAS